jgi:hypothetical protein
MRLTRTTWAAVVVMVAVTPVLWVDAKGRAHIKGADVVVVDAVAYKTEDGVEVALLAKVFDRKAAARDSKIDSMDVMRTGGATITLKIDKDGSFSCVDWMSSQGGGSTCNSDLTKALKLTANTAERVAGTFKLNANGDTADVTFDLKVESSVARAGTPLPAGGGEPGKAAIAHFAALEKGDFAALKATAPPEIRTQMDASEKSGEAKEMLKMLRDMSPKRVRLLTGVLDGDEATIDFEGVMDGKPAKGVVELVRVSGVWYVRGTTNR